MRAHTHTRAPTHPVIDPSSKVDLFPSRTVPTKLFVQDRQVDIHVIINMTEPTDDGEGREGRAEEGREGRGREGRGGRKGEGRGGKRGEGRGGEGDRKGVHT